MEKLNYFKKLKNFDKKQIVSGFAKNLGLQELIEEKPKIEIMKKLNEENEKIKQNLNNKLRNLMKERQEISSFIGVPGEGINSIEELQNIKNRSINSKIDEQLKYHKKKKFSTSIIKKNPLKKINFSTIINNTHYRTENSKEKNIKKKKKLKLTEIPIQKLYKKKSVHFQIDNNLIRKKTMNDLSSKKNIYHMPSMKDIDKNKTEKKVTKYLHNLFQENKKEMLSIGLNKGISSVEKLKQLTANYNNIKKEKELNQVFNSENNSLNISKSSSKNQIENKNNSLNKLSDSKINESGFLNNSVISNNLEHEKFRKLTHKNIVEDSLSYSEGNKDIYLDLDEKNYALDPDGIFKFFWDYFILFTILYYIMVYPIFLAFYQKEYLFILIINIILDFSYLVDFVLNFFIGFYTFEEELIKSNYLIFKEYINSGTFIINLFTSIPIGTIIGKYSENKAFDRINLLLFLKLMKIGNLIEDNEKRGFLNFFYHILILLLKQLFDLFQ